MRRTPAALAVLIGAQDCHAEASGAFTGDVSAEMLKDAGARAVIVGHSERRTYHKETDADVRGKVLAARRAGLLAIVCVGETRAEREAGSALRGGRDASSTARCRDGATAETLVVAYEPVWAIGTGAHPDARTTSPRCMASSASGFGSRFGEAGQRIRILYGGSVKPANAEELMSVADVDGALVGGASLKADEFLAIAARVPVSCACDLKYRDWHSDRSG